TGARAGTSTSASTRVLFPGGIMVDISRRDFVVAGALAGVGLSKPATALAAPQTTLAGTPAVHVRRARPVVIASANGNASRDEDGKTCVVKAFEMITQGRDVLESLIAGVNIVELDPEDTSVGYGGLPNADGVVQLDSCCMHGPLKLAGGVAAIE